MKFSLAFTCPLVLIGAQALAKEASHAHAAWVQYTGAGGTQARVVIDADATAPDQTKCPAMSYNGSAQKPMQLRSSFAPAGFEGVRVCVADVDPSMANMSVAGLALPTPVSDPQNVAVLGDTGCRVAYGIVQNCTGDGQGPKWNYQGVANVAAAADPDLFIHVGDMHYRETGACDAGCVQSNIGFSWASWKADFFDPSAQVFATAPLIPVRGNHEDCTRAWKGWFFLLDPNPIATTSWPASCPGKNGTPLDAAGKDWSYTKPYPIVFDNFQVIVMDTARIDHDYGRVADPGAVVQYQGEFSAIETLAQNASVPSWLVTHRPFWAVASYGSESAPKAGATDLTLQVALKKSAQKVLPPQIKMTMAGHVHLAQQLTFTDGRPVQFVFGNSGTKRDPELGTGGKLHANTRAALNSLGADVDAFFWSYDFSFGLISPKDASDWNVVFHDINGAPLHTSTVAR